MVRGESSVGAVTEGSNAVKRENASKEASPDLKERIAIMPATLRPEALFKKSKSSS
jgi:hypothetical protein